MKTHLKNNGGFTLVEMEVAIAVFSLIMVAISSFILYIYKTQRYSVGQLESINAARRAMEIVTEEIRNARQAETGAFAINTAESQSFVFYSDIDGDNLTEKIRYFLDNGELKKGVTEPNYTGVETISVIASYVVNNSDPIFAYYDENFTGSEVSLTTPADVTQVKIVKIILKIDKEVNINPPVLSIETSAHIRNLKEN